MDIKIIHGAATSRTSLALSPGWDFTNSTISFMLLANTRDCTNMHNPSLLVDLMRKKRASSLSHTPITVSDTFLYKASGKRHMPGRALDLPFMYYRAVSDVSQLYILNANGRLLAGSAYPIPTDEWKSAAGIMN